MLSILRPLFPVCRKNADRIFAIRPVGISDGAFLCVKKRSKRKRAQVYRKRAERSAFRPCLRTSFLINIKILYAGKHYFKGKIKSCELFSFPGIDTIRDNTEVLRRYRGWRAVKTENFLIKEERIPMEKIRFPKDFIFGTATSAAQLEGAAGGGWQGGCRSGMPFPGYRAV